jgi:hypothetical protein
VSRGPAAHGSVPEPGPGRTDPSRRVSIGDPDSILVYLGDRACVLHPRRGGDEEGGGGDVDCAVRRLDPRWPLRLPGKIRLCQSFHYDVRAWYWVLEEDGRVMALDTLDDPAGLGRYGFATVPSLFDRGPLAPSGPRAAYLAVKRLRKGEREAAVWAAIGRLAVAEPAAFAGSWARGLSRSGAPSVAASRRTSRRGGRRSGRRRGADCGRGERWPGQGSRPVGSWSASWTPPG